MGKFLNPFTDVGFKRLFGQEVNKELLIEFLNDLLAGERRIENLAFLDKEIIPESLGGRVVIFDILCRESDGTQFIVEMQNQYQDFFYDRGLYYLCRMISKQGKQGPWNYKICPVYGIYFLNFNLPQLDKFRTDIVLSDRDTGKQMNTKIRQVYLSLPYFTREAEECETGEHRWIYILKNMETLDRMPFEAQQAVFQKLFEVADLERMTREERLRYDESLKNFRDYNNIIASAERISREEGREEGRKEGHKEVATQLKKAGVDIRVIIQTTGLPAEEIDQL